MLFPITFALTISHRKFRRPAFSPVCKNEIVQDFCFNIFFIEIHSQSRFGRASSARSHRCKKMLKVERKSTTTTRRFRMWPDKIQIFKVLDAKVNRNFHTVRISRYQVTGKFARYMHIFMRVLDANCALCTVSRYYIANRQYRKFAVWKRLYLAFLFEPIDGLVSCS